MFLATTAVTSFWDPSQPMLFLGEWCLRRDRRDDWEHLERHVLPCVWDDREAFLRAADYLDEFGERVIALLTDFLNSLHGVRHDTRYWRVLAGSWLLNALHVYYDRWISVREALRAHPDLTTIVLDRADHRHAVSAETWTRLMTIDEFNLQLYSEVFAALGYRFPARRLRWGIETTPHAPTMRTHLRNAVTRLVASAGAAAGRLLPGAVLLHQATGYLSRNDIFRLMVTSGFRVWPFETTDVPRKETGPSETRRKEIVSFPATDEFERFFFARLSETLPSAVVEDYESNRRLARTVRPAAVIATFGGWYASDLFRFTAAEGHARGARLVGVQHGGGYGILKRSPAERLERRTADRFLAWGWSDPQKNPRVTNVPAATMTRFRSVPRTRKSPTELLFVATVHPRYVYRFHSTPVASQWERYYAWQERFFDALPVELREHVRFRGNRYAHEFGQGEPQRLAARFPWLRWDERPHLSESLSHARLVVADHHGTSFLQVLAAGAPLVLFWDPNLWELQSDAVAPFNRLRQAGILFDDPESAAAAAARVYPVSDSWWAGADVASSHLEFANRFGLWRDGWAREWVHALRHVSHQGEEVPSLREATGS